MDILQQKLREIDAEMAQLQTVKDALLRAMKSNNVQNDVTATLPTASNGLTRPTRGRRKVSRQTIIKSKVVAPPATSPVSVPKLPVDDAAPSPELMALFEQANKE